MRMQTVDLDLNRLGIAIPVVVVCRAFILLDMKLAHDVEGETYAKIVIFVVVS
jgi:hypothetical protein